MNDTCLSAQNSQYALQRIHNIFSVNVIWLDIFMAVKLSYNISYILPMVNDVSSNFRTLL